MNETCKRCGLPGQTREVRSLTGHPYSSDVLCWNCPEESRRGHVSWCDGPTLDQVMVELLQDGWREGLPSASTRTLIGPGGEELHLRRNLTGTKLIEAITQKMVDVHPRDGLAGLIWLNSLGIAQGAKDELIEEWQGPNPPELSPTAQVTAALLTERAERASAANRLWWVTQQWKMHGEKLREVAEGALR